MLKKTLILLLLIFMVSCGTDTGNPERASSEDTSNASSRKVTHVESLVSKSCDLLISCFDVLTQENCKKELMSQSLMVEALGLSPEDFSNLDEVKKSEFIKEIKTNTQEAKLCLEDIIDLKCEDDSVINAVELEAEEPFVNVHSMVPESCLSSYTL